MKAHTIVDIKKDRTKPNSPPSFQPFFLPVFIFLAGSAWRAALTEHWHASACANLLCVRRTPAAPMQFYCQKSPAQSPCIKQGQMSSSSAVWIRDLVMLFKYSHSQGCPEHHTSVMTNMVWCSVILRLEIKPGHLPPQFLLFLPAQLPAPIFTVSFFLHSSLPAQACLPAPVSHPARAAYAPLHLAGKVFS